MWSLGLPAVLTKILNNISKRNDVILAFMLVCVVFMMILPLPPILVDVLIASNLTISAILLMVAIYLKMSSPFPPFPRCSC